jgi:RNA polymerase sigma-70 factor (ECF subfamily)
LGESRADAVSDDDLALVRQFLRTRGEEAFRTLYRAHTAALYALAYRLAGGEQDSAEDLVQETWVRAVRSLPSFRAESALRSWLCGLLVNVRRERVRTAWRSVDAPDAVNAEPAAPTDPPEAAIDLERAIAMLPAGARDVFVLHDVYGYTHDEIASMLGIVAGTSKSQLTRARGLLRARMDHD